MAWKQQYQEYLKTNLKMAWGNDPILAMKVQHRLTVNTSHRKAKYPIYACKLGKLLPCCHIFARCNTSSGRLSFLAIYQYFMHLE